MPSKGLLRGRWTKMVQYHALASSQWVHRWIYAHESKQGAIWTRIRGRSSCDAGEGGTGKDKELCLAVAVRQCIVCLFLMHFLSLTYYF